MPDHPERIPFHRRGDAHPSAHRRRVRDESKVTHALRLNLSMSTHEIRGGAAAELEGGVDEMQPRQIAPHRVVVSHGEMNSCAEHVELGEVLAGEIIAGLRLAEYGEGICESRLFVEYPRLVHLLVGPHRGGGRESEDARKHGLPAKHARMIPLSR